MISSHTNPNGMIEWCKGRLMVAGEPKVEITKSYIGYTPPLDLTASVQLLIRYVPPKYLAGLECVVLTNASGLSHEGRREKTWSRWKQVRIADALAFYQKTTPTSPARIQMFADNICNSWPTQLLRIPLLRHCVLANTLYHEIGHHIHAAVHPEYAEREAVADRWTRYLTTSFVKKRYWYLLPAAFVMTVAFRATRLLWKRSGGKRN